MAQYSARASAVNGPSFQMSPLACVHASMPCGLTSYGALSLTIPRGQHFGVQVGRGSCPPHFGQCAPAAGQDLINPVHIQSKLSRCELHGVADNKHILAQQLAMWILPSESIKKKEKPAIKLVFTKHESISENYIFNILSNFSQNANLC